ncbi:MAG TPA: ABC transporter ATP-binding protein [Pilimelia sp.]|nr:ABC transporter ATP-binding protein [Pilimelia sp.]
MLRGALLGSLWMGALMLPPYVMARAVDDGLGGRSTGRLVGWAAVLLLLGAVIAGLGVLRHRTMTMIRVDAAYRTVQVVVRHATRLGAALPRRVPAGDLSHLQAGDAVTIAQALTVTGPGVGAVFAYVGVAVLVFRISPVLAGVVTLGVPLLAVAVGPLLGRLHGAEHAYREQQGQLTARAGDIVAGLRVLCGIGGKAAFAGRYRARSARLTREGYRVGALTSWVQALGAGLPTVLLAAVTWLGARMAASGSITVGELVAVYGYVAALLVPVYFFVEGADDVPRALVAAGRVVRILATAPDPPGRGRAAAVPAEAALCDPASGLVLPGGRLVGLAADRPDAARAVVERLGRHAPSGVTWGGVRLSDLSLAEVRRRILVADDDAYLFAGPVRAVVAPRAAPADADLERALWTAAATDVVDGLPGGLEGRLQARGRNLSGGQRQRLRLVRALLADPGVLLLVEPTSALDAQTEATVAARVRAARRGRTTLVVSTSPLVLNEADQVCYLVDGRVAAVGTHGELLATQPGYRALVFRGADGTGGGVDGGAPAAAGGRGCGR